MHAIAEVALDGRVTGSIGTLTYLNPHGAEVGQVCLAPLGARTVFGVVLAARTVSEDDLPVLLGKMRSLGAPIKGLDIPVPLIELSRYCSAEYLTSLGLVLSGAIPPGVRDRLTSTWSLTNESHDFDLTAGQQEILRVLKDVGGTLIATKSKPISAAMLRSLRLLRGKGFVREVLTIAPKQERASIPQSLRITNDDDAIEKFLLKEGRKKPAQALTLIRLQGSSGATFAPSEIKALSGCTDQTLRALLTSKFLLDATQSPEQLSVPPKPSPQQANALERITKCIADQDSRAFLLFGVTGSGKTEVYLRAAEATLKAGRQVLFLVPEIALTAQVIGQLRARFGQAVAVLHSNLGPQERLENWMKINDGKAPVILGARSAIFAPARNLGLIIMDEEHEGSYKQESAPRYHTKALALKLSELHGATLVLGSATPSIESYWESTIGQLERLEMPDRAADAKLPEVFIEDLSAQYRQPGRPSMLTPALHDRMVECLEKKKQAILFLNRRAFSPYLSCRECGHVYECEACSVSLSYRKQLAMLVCHYCGFQRSAPDVCDSCGSSKIAPMGTGTEKVEEFLKMEFPEARVARLDRDVIKKKGALEEVFALMRAGEIDFLVGTQMVAKGLDFPGVVLVGTINADTGLHLPDFRAGERTFQLLSQVAGRAGRGKSPGEVVIQTFSTDHPAIVKAQAHAYEEFYELTLEERELAAYPPFVRLVNIVFSGPGRMEVKNLAKAYGAKLAESMPGANILGPVDCPMERINNQWRVHVLVKVLPMESLAPIQNTLDALDHGNVVITVDVDPQSML
jgi:primosomal protein N' (replication factor Y)